MGEEEREGEREGEEEGKTSEFGDRFRMFLSPLRVKERMRKREERAIKGERKREKEKMKIKGVKKATSFSIIKI